MYSVSKTIKLINTQLQKLDPESLTSNLKTNISKTYLHLNLYIFNQVFQVASKSPGWISCIQDVKYRTTQGQSKASPGVRPIDVIYHQEKGNQKQLLMGCKHLETLKEIQSRVICISNGLLTCRMFSIKIRPRFVIHGISPYGCGCSTTSAHTTSNGRRRVKISWNTLKYLDNFATKRLNSGVCFHI